LHLDLPATNDFATTPKNVPVTIPVLANDSDPDGDSLTVSAVAGLSGNVSALRAHEVEQRFVDGRMTFEKIEGTDFELPCELVLLAMGFVGPERPGLLEQLGVDLNERGNVTRDDAFRTNLDKVFVCGDMGRGQSLIVWAIAEGRSCAAAVDEFLMGETLLPAPIRPDTVQMR